MTDVPREHGPAAREAQPCDAVGTITLHSQCKGTDAASVQPLHHVYIYSSIRRLYPKRLYFKGTVTIYVRAPRDLVS